MMKEFGQTSCSCSSYLAAASDTAGQGKNKKSLAAGLVSQQTT